MALLKTNHYGLERHKIHTGENNDLMVTGVRVLIHAWCSKATEEQILRRVEELMDAKDASGNEVCQRIEKLFEEEFTSLKVHISRSQEKEHFHAICPFSIHININDENNGICVETKPGKDIDTEEIVEVLEISISRF